jgi:hypothetical protein
MKSISAIFVLLLAFEAGILGLAAQESHVPAAQLVTDSLHNEMAAHVDGDHLAYTSFEQSARTGHHLWEERVVETEQGVLRRLISVDGRPLSAEIVKAENERIARLLSHPEEFHQANSDRDSDEKSRQRVINAMGSAFLFTYDGVAKGCTRIRFTGNPAFKPSSYQERVLRFLEGTVYVNESQKRFCGMDGVLSQRVEIGFGILGSLEKGGRVHVIRVQTASGAWENSVVQLHLVGRMLVVRSISQDIDQKRTNMRDIPPHLTLAQAAEFIKP